MHCSKMRSRRITQPSVKLTNRYNLHRKLRLNNIASYLDLRHLRNMPYYL